MMESESHSLEVYRSQHKLRLSYMPWLYKHLKPLHKTWAEQWQREIQDYLCKMETVVIGKNCFIAPEAKLFAEPGRPIIIGDDSFVAADTVIHGPVTIGKNVSINHHVTMDGGSKGIHVGNDTRIAAYCHLYAFNHGMVANALISEQPTQSRGIFIGEDVWLGASVGVTDGVIIGAHAVVGMGSQVSRNVDAFHIVAGNPINVVGDRRHKRP